MPILAEADRVIASEAINAAPIRTIRLMQGPPIAGSRCPTSSNRGSLFHEGLPDLPIYPGVNRLTALGPGAAEVPAIVRWKYSGKLGSMTVRWS